MSGTRRPVPPIILDRFVTGYITKRSALIAPFRAIGINIVRFNDALLSGINIECSDDSTLQRRPGFSKFCAQQLRSSEIVNQFYSVRNLSGEVTTLVDTNQALRV